jgi:hypothetical protein
MDLFCQYRHPTYHRYHDFNTACECAAKFYLGIGDKESSLHHFRLAHKKYTEWGAITKAEQIFAFANETFDHFLELSN